MGFRVWSFWGAGFVFRCQNRWESFGFRALTCEDPRAQNLLSNFFWVAVHPDRSVMFYW